jgi:hypothetical protein
MIEGKRMSFKMSRARRLGDTMIAVSSLGAVVAGTAIISTDARMLLANTITDSAELGAMAFRAQTLGHELIRAANAYRAANVPIVGFAIFALVLTFLMFRT